jgi:hypothetical protein
MAKKKSIIITNKSLGILLIIGLVLQYVLPRAGLNGFDTISVLIYLLVAIYLILF